MSPRHSVDSIQLRDQFGMNALPTSVVVGKDGRIILAEPNIYRDLPEKLLKAVYPD